MDAKNEGIEKGTPNWDKNILDICLQIFQACRVICSIFWGPLSIITFQRLYWTFNLQDCFAVGFGPHNLFSLTCVCCTGCCGLSFHLCSRRTTWEDSRHLDKHPWGFVGQWWDGGAKVLGVWMVQTILVGGFKDFLCSSLLGEMI